MTDDARPSGLIAKVARATIAVGGFLQPDRRNTEQSYDYLSADRIKAVCGQALAAEGIAVIPRIANAVTEPQTHGGKARYVATVEFNILVTDGTDSMEMRWVGYGVDYAAPDKAAYKAYTSGMKYLLSNLLIVGAGNEDGEHENIPDDEDEVGRAKRATASRPSAPAPAKQPAGPAQPARPNPPPPDRRQPTQPLPAPPARPAQPMPGQPAPWVDTTPISQQPVPTLAELPVSAGPHAVDALPSLGDLLRRVRVVGWNVSWDAWDDRAPKAAKWASKNRTELLDELTIPELQALLDVLVRELPPGTDVDKLPPRPELEV